MLSLTILNKNTAEELSSIQYGGHPLQIDVPSKMAVVLASEEFLFKKKIL